LAQNGDEWLAQCSCWFNVQTESPVPAAQEVGSVQGCSAKVKDLHTFW